MNPKDAQFYFTIGLGIIVWAFTAGVLWTQLNNRIDNNRKEAENKAAEVAKQDEAEREKLRHEAGEAHVGLEGQINGLGGRLKTCEGTMSNLGGRMDGAERQLQGVAQQGLDVTSRLGRVEARVDAMDSHITEFKLELFQKLSDLNSTIQKENGQTRDFLHERDARLRERLARVEERKGIEEIRD